VVVTFDAMGVSGHRNHVLLYHGVRRYGQRAVAARAAPARLLGLKSANFFEKYSFTLVTSVELFVEHVLRLVLGRAGQLNVRLSMLQAAAAPIIFYSDLNMLAVAYAAMAAGHFLQMVWFRYGWLVLSRYLTFNQLVEISV
jgi:N-acetylglucosaminylphosphatidylinositol deacetylase